MSTINNLIKQKLLLLIKERKSINQIAKELNLYKSTIYYHYRKILGKKILSPSFILSESEIEGEIIGAFAADGGSCICKNSNYIVVFYLGGNETEYLRGLSLLLENYFQKKPHIYKRKDKNVYMVRYHSKSIYNFMKHYLSWNGKKTYSVQLKSTEMRKEFLYGFIRSYFDCDGFSDKLYKKIQIGGVSEKMISQIYLILKILGFSPDYRVNRDKRINCSDMHYINLKNEQAEKFIRTICPRNPVRIKWWGCQDLNSRS